MNGKTRQADNTQQPDFREPFESVLLKQQEREILELSKKLTAEREARQEDNFAFVVVIIILLNVIFFSFLDGLMGPLVLFVLELLVLTLLARRMGVKGIAVLLDRILHRITNGISNKE